MSHPVAQFDRGNRSRGKFGAPTTPIWLVSCLVHALLLWALSTFSTARGVGGYAEGTGLIIEGRFLGESGEEQANGNEDGGGTLPTGSPEIQVVSASPTEARTADQIDDPSPTDDNTEAGNEVATPTRTSPARNERRDVTVIEDEPRPEPFQQRSRSAPNGASAQSRKGRGNGSRAGNGVSAGRGHGDGTTFFDIGGRGTKIVYVIDRSDSMQEKRRLDAARNELLCSLHELAETSHVQVLFYNHDVAFIDAASRPTLLRNTPVQQRKFAQFAAGIQPDGATDHLRALALALKLTPDAIFLLTDAAEPKLHEADLDRVQRANRRRVPIHAIELGIGPLLESDNFLMRLARQNGGTYRYCNVEELFENTLEIPAVTREDHESPTTRPSRVR